MPHLLPASMPTFAVIVTVKVLRSHGYAELCEMILEQKYVSIICKGLASLGSA
jgi:hypothetical protein